MLVATNKCPCTINTYNSNNTMVTFHFRIDLKELINNGEIVTYLENGQIIKSESSAQKLDGKFKYATLIYVRKFPNLAPLYNTTNIFIF